MQHLSLLVVVSVILVSCMDEKSTEYCRTFLQDAEVPSIDLPEHLADMKSDEIRQIYVDAANSGNAKAAGRLADYYIMTGTNKTGYESLKWLSRATDLGDAVSTHNYAIELYRQGGAKNCARAIELLKKSNAIDPEGHASRENWIELIRNDLKGCSGS